MNDVTGPEHYRQAETILAELQTFQAGLTGDMDPDEYEEAVNLLKVNLGCAQVHATLAMAAANALNDSNGGSPLADYAEWCKTASLAAPIYRRKAA